jgi:predicted transcriptional regulator of viral defense system
VDQAVVRLALEQHCVFGLRQLSAHGISDRGVQHRAEGGRLHRVHAGVYSLVPPRLLTLDGRCMAAVLACGEGAALSHRSAAHLQRLTRTAPRTIEVTVPTPGGRGRAGIAIHRSTTLRAHDVETVRRIPCTTIARTIFDLGELDRRTVERALDEAYVSESLDVVALREQLEHNARRLRAAALVTRVLADHRAGDTATWNALEERVFTLARAAGVPEPQVNKWVDLGDGEPMIRADFLWREQRVIVETDGWRTHGTRAAFERDRRRDQRALLAGWTVVRVTWRQAHREARRIAQTIVGLVAARAADRPAAGSPPAAAA